MYLRILAKINDYVKKNTKFFVISYLCFFFLYFISQIHFFYVPDSDFFQYIGDGRTILQNPLAKIVTPPLYSIIIYLFETYLPIATPGITGGIFLNIISLIFSLYFLWLLIRKEFKIYAFLPLTILALNPLTRIVYLQPLNIPLATLFVLIAIYYYRKYPLLAYAFTLLAFFCRTESIILCAAFVLYDIFVLRRIKIHFGLLIVLFVAALTFLRPLISFDKQDYYSEIIARRNEIPNFTFARNSLATAPFLIFSKSQLTGGNVPFRPVSLDSLIMLLYVFWVVMGVILCFRKKIYMPLLFFFYFIFYIILHMIFPDSVLRYSYPTLPFGYVLLFWPTALLYTQRTLLKALVHLIFVASLTLYICIRAITIGQEYLNNQKWVKAEKRIAAEWLNDNIKKPTTVYTFEFWVSQYYSRNMNVTYANSVNPHAWQEKLCRENNVIIIIDNQTQNPISYFDSLNGLDYFAKIKYSEELQQDLLLLKKIDLGYRWAEIYQLKNPKKEWCDNLTS